MTDTNQKIVMKKIISIAQGVVFVYASIAVFLVTYAYSTSDFSLGLLFGDKWVSSKFFVAGFILFLPVNMIGGIAGHTETFGKSIYDVKAMGKFNILRYYWIV